jgi:ketopantoate reductase
VLKTLKTIFGIEFMTTKVDMTYSFLRDDEPTDEQLQVIMQEVADEARRNQEEIARQVIQNIERESRRVLAAQQARQK